MKRFLLSGVAVVFVVGCTSAPASTESLTTPAAAPADPSSTPVDPATETPTPVPSDEDVVAGMFDAGGHSLYMSCAGTGAPTIVYLHGRVWDRAAVPLPHANGLRFQERLSDDYRVCVYDRRNLGRSETVDATQMPDDAISDLRAALESAGVEPPYVLLGASFGGLLAYHYLGSHPQEVAGMVLLDSPIPDELQLESMFPQEDGYETFADHDQCCTPERLADFTTFQAAERHIGQEPDVPVVYLISSEPRAPHVAGYDSAFAELREAYIARFPRGELVAVDAPHFMEPAAPDAIEDALRRVIAQVDS